MQKSTFEIYSFVFLYFKSGGMFYALQFESASVQGGCNPSVV